MTREKAELLRYYLEKAAELLQDEDASEVIEFFPEWQVGIFYPVDYRVRYGKGLYRCLQAHTSQSDWTPDITPALWSTRIN